jgi:ADP-heptose:LPS heptosyltransferase
MIKNRNLFRITRFIFFKLPGLFNFFTKFRSPKKRVLIIKTDAIGDFILFRNFIEITKKSEIYKDHQVDLLGNKLWKDIAIQYDSGFISNFLFINPDELYEAPLATFKLGWRLFKNNYQVVLQPSSTRLFITDGLAALTAAKQIIGFESDNEGIPERYKSKTDKFYTQRFSFPKNIYFEFDRSKFFFENVLNSYISLDAPYIPVNKTAEKGIVIFPGAGFLKRGWEADRFLALIKLIRQHTSQPLYVAGGPSEIEIGNYLAENLPPGSINNLTGKTSLPQLIELISNSALIIANETSAIHIAAATQTKAICILGGGHFGRFAPYPAHMQNKPVCIYEKMECFNCNWMCIFKTNENEPYPCISGVSLEKVWDAALPLLPLI